MSYDESLARRVEKNLRRRRGWTRKKMFGGICYMLNGNMCCGVLDDELIVRAKPDEYERAMKRPHTRVLDFTGRPMKGFVVVRPPGWRAEAALKNWITLGIRCARSRPPKKPTKAPAKK